MKITETNIGEEKSSSSSCTSESVSDEEHELDRDKLNIKEKAKQLHKSHTIVDVDAQKLLLSPKAKV